MGTMDEIKSELKSIDKIDELFMQDPQHSREEDIGFAARQSRKEELLRSAEYIKETEACESDRCN
jgi:hypothetical protein